MERIVVSWANALLNSRRLRWIMWLLFASYTSCLLYWMFLGFGRGIHRADSFMYNVIPLRTIGHYLFHMHAFSWRTWVINMFGNIGVFMPYGVCLPFLFRRATAYGTFILMFGCPLVALEILQMLLHVGTFDVDDILLNGLGASVAYALFMAVKRKIVAAIS
ncbi:VanZ family protein [Paenibacillus sp. SI8]|uniref:VanZ family protein n=1 Tax=unclassified Paenibacillus TaxID=185978 RepID=UPI0034656B8B